MPLLCVADVYVAVLCWDTYSIAVQRYAGILDMLLVEAGQGSPAGSAV